MCAQKLHSPKACEAPEAGRIRPDETGTPVVSRRGRASSVVLRGFGRLCARQIAGPTGRDERRRGEWDKKKIKYNRMTGEKNVFAPLDGGARVTAGTRGELPTTGWETNAETPASVSREIGGRTREKNGSQTLRYC